MAKSDINILKFINTVRPMKCYAEWIEMEKDSDLVANREYYGYINIKPRPSHYSFRSSDQLNKKKNGYGWTKCWIAWSKCT